MSKFYLLVEDSWLLNEHKKYVAEGNSRLGIPRTTTNFDDVKVFNDIIEVNNFLRLLCVEPTIMVLDQANYHQEKMEKNIPLKENELIEKPVVSTSVDGKMFVLHNYTTITGKVIISKSEAALLLIELWKFLDITE